MRRWPWEAVYYSIHQRTLDVLDMQWWRKKTYAVSFVVLHLERLSGRLRRNVDEVVSTLGEHAFRRTFYIAPHCAILVQLLHLHILACQHMTLEKGDENESRGEVDSR
jgi:hypothetical protein